jgi:endonuclease-3
MDGVRNGDLNAGAEQGARSRRKAGGDSFSAPCSLCPAPYVDVVAITGPYPTRKARAEFIDQRLAALYPAPAIPLDHKDAYTLLIAVLLSAQCTDKRVNATTPQLFARADNPAAMTRLSVEEINALVRPCGLAPRKAQAIHALSSLLLAKHGGAVPQTFAALEELPGVGHKTASVVMTQAFGVPSFPVDTHIHRLAQRWKLTNGKSVEQTEADLKKLFPRDHWNLLHLRIIYYGREHCTAWGCDGTTCEICRTLFPKRRKPVATKKA